jgi:hypothetical protein
MPQYLDTFKSTTNKLIRQCGPLYPDGRATAGVCLYGVDPDHGFMTRDLVTPSQFVPMLLIPYVTSWEVPQGWGLNFITDGDRWGLVNVHFVEDMDFTDPQSVLLDAPSRRLFCEEPGDLMTVKLIDRDGVPYIEADGYDLIPITEAQIAEIRDAGTLEEIRGFIRNSWLPSLRRTIVRSLEI